MFNFPRIGLIVTAALTLISGGVRAVEAANGEIAHIADTWATLKYLRDGDPRRLAKALDLEQEAEALARRQPGSAEPLLWQANILCLTAELMHSLGSLDKVNKARMLLEKAEALDPGSSGVQAQLGSLYYEVPGWPISFGNGGRAEMHLRRALEIAPDDMDANYFMGDFLLQKGHPADAIPYLEKALAAAHAVMPTTIVEGRLQEIAHALNESHKRANPR